MSVLSRACLIAILVASLLNIPAFAANEAPLGLVTQAQNAQIGNTKVDVGTSIFPGDTLATDVGGTLRLKFGASQLYLLSASSASLAQTATTNVVHAMVNRGTVGFSSNGKDQVELEIPQGILHAANGEPAYGQVTITGPLEVVISAYKGTLVLDYNGVSREIPAGKSYRVTLDLEAAAQPQTPTGAGTGSGSGSPKRALNTGSLAWSIVAVGAAGGVGYVIWDILSESSSAPKN
ncbi:MAG TPA: hypothetical protein VN884_08370 [Candidatus Sulfotelmatobacter sp.]|jgi:hypothetical protein|nr:hypothetical protein [Candidatus Sulfotelmatobacter sp.]